MNNKKGFTMLETVISIMIFSIVILVFVAASTRVKVSMNDTDNKVLYSYLNTMNAINKDLYSNKHKPTSFKSINNNTFKINQYIYKINNNNEIIRENTINNNSIILTRNVKTNILKDDDKYIIDFYEKDIIGKTITLDYKNKSMILEGSD